MIRRFPLRFSIPVILFIVFFGVSAVQLKKEIRLSDETVERNMISHAAHEGTQTVTMLEYFFQKGEEGEALNTLSWAGGDPDNIGAFVLDDQNRVILASHYELKGRPLAETTAASFQDMIEKTRQTFSKQHRISSDGLTLRTTFPVKMPPRAGELRSHETGVFFQEHDVGNAKKTGLAKAVNEFMEFMVSLGIFCFGLWVLFEWVIARRVSALVEGTKCLEEGKEFPEVNLGGRDEIAALGHAFNGMAKTIRENSRVLKKNEEKYRSLVENSPHCICHLDGEGKILYINPTGLLLNKLSDLGKAMGRDGFQNVREDYFREIKDALWRAKKGETVTLEHASIIPGGRTLWWHSTLSPLTYRSGGVETILRISSEITTRKQAELRLLYVNRALRVLSEGNHALAVTESEENLLNKMCRIIVKSGGYRLAWVGYAEDNLEKTVRPVAHDGFEVGYLEEVRVTWADSERGRGPTGTSIRTGQPCVVKNTWTDPSFAPWREEAKRRGFASSLGLPLKEKGRAFGCLSIYGREPDIFHDEEVRHLQDLANNLSYGIISIRSKKERERMEEALRMCAAGFPSVTGREFFEAVARHLVTSLKVDFAFIGEFLDGKSKKIRISALCRKGEILPSFEYDLAHTPCEQVTIRGLCCFSSNVQKLFPKDLLLAEMGIESYAGIPLYSKSGDALGIMVIMHTHPLPEEKIAKSLLSIYADRVAAELERQQSIKEMNKLFIAVEQSPVSVVITDIEGKIEYVNPHFIKVTGYSLEEVQGKNPRILKSEEKSSEEYMVMWETLVSGKEWHGEFHNKAKNGELYWESAVISSIKDGEGRITHYIAVKEDITDRKRVERELNKAKEEAMMQSLFAQRLSALAAVSGGISHELSQPLSIIGLHAETIKVMIEKGRDLEQSYLLDNVEKTLEQVDRAVDIIDHMKEFSSGSEGYEKGRLSLFRLARSVENLFGAQLKAHQISLKTEIPEDLVILANRNRMEQVLVNLISNARDVFLEKAFPPGRAKEILIRVFREGDFTVMDVSDTGSGVPVALREKLFEPFVTGKTAKKGSGLGLSICQRILHDYGATIELHSTGNEGATLRIKFPIDENFKY